MNNFAAKVVKGLQDNSTTTATISLVDGTVKPATSTGPGNSTTRIGEFQVDYTGHNFGTTPGQNDIRIQFYEHFDTTGNVNSDTYALLCGDRIRKTYTDAAASPSSIDVTTVTADLPADIPCSYTQNSLYTYTVIVFKETIWSLHLYVPFMEV
jgi:hypothetical protein